MKNIIIILYVLISISGCSTFAFTNEKFSPQNNTSLKNRAQFVIENDRGNDDTLFILALSGGGSRAAYFSAEVMLALQELQGKNDKNLLQSVDVISSVSGGSLPAAYYVISKDPNDTTNTVASRRIWDRDTVENLMSLNFIARWIGNWFWPDNFALYWTTAYDRSDIMAQTFADNMFDVSNGLSWGVDLTFNDINKERPYLIINSTIGSSENFGTSFTFTSEDFTKKIDSNISQYKISRAVMASASFPAVFNYMTLCDFRGSEECDKYMHVFDGGNVDNLGLESTHRIISTEENKKYKKIVILLVDAFTPPTGVPAHEYDSMNVFSYFMDLNFLDSTDSLLQKIRKESIDKTKKLVTQLNSQGKQAIFYHLKFDETKYFKNQMAKISVYDFDKGEEVLIDRPINEVLSKIPTSFNISEKHTDAIRKAASLLVNSENRCIKEIQSLIRDEVLRNNKASCVWPISQVDIAKN